MAITKKQLEEQNTALRKENEKLHKQIDARVEKSGAYQALKAQIANKISKKKEHISDRLRTGKINILSYRQNIAT